MLVISWDNLLIINSLYQQFTGPSLPLGNIKGLIKPPCLHVSTPSPWQKGGKRNAISRPTVYYLCATIEDDVAGQNRAVIFMSNEPSMSQWLFLGGCYQKSSLTMPTSSEYSSLSWKEIGNLLTLHQLDDHSTLTGLWSRIFYSSC